MAKDTVSDTMEMCAIEAQDKFVRPTVPLDVWSLIGVILDKEVVAGHVQRE